MAILCFSQDEYGEQKKGLVPRGRWIPEEEKEKEKEKESSNKDSSPSTAREIF